MISIPKIKEVAQKAVTFGLKPTEESFPELPNALVWIRFVLAVTYGLYVGNNLVRSGPVLLQALNLIAFVPTLYCKFYLGVQGDAFATQIVFAGLFNAIALCLLIWLYMFTAAHDAEEAQLSALLISAVAKGVGTSPDDETLSDGGSDPLMAAAGEADADFAAVPPAAAEEPEF